MTQSGQVLRRAASLTQMLRKQRRQQNSDYMKKENLSLAAPVWVTQSDLLGLSKSCVIETVGAAEERIYCSCSYWKNCDELQCESVTLMVLPLQYMLISFIFKYDNLRF